MKKIILTIVTTVVLVIGLVVLIWNHFDYKPNTKDDKNFVIVKTYKKDGYPFPKSFDKGTSIGQIAKAMFGSFDALKYRKPPNKDWQLIKDDFSLLIYEDIIIQNVK